MNKYRVAFFGTPKIAVKILAALKAMENVELVFVVSQPDKLVGRKQKVVFSAVKQFCLENNLTCLQPVKVSEIYDQLVDANLDFFITCAYGQFIPTKLLAIPKIAPLNIHGSLLPKYRGGAPIQYAVLNREKTSGVSLMKMVKQMDAGPVYSTKQINLDEHETSGTLFDKLGDLGAQLIQSDLQKIADGSLTAIEQDESLATFAGNITSDLEQINWDDTSLEIDALVRALNPSPIAYTMLENERYKIGDVEVVENNSAIDEIEPGTILEFQSAGILVKTGSGVIKILEIQLPGKKMQPASNYFASKGSKQLKMGAKFSF